MHRILQTAARVMQTFKRAHGGRAKLSVLEGAFGYLRQYRMKAQRNKELTVTTDGLSFVFNKFSRELLGYFEIFLESEYFGFDGFAAGAGSTVVDAGANIGLYMLKQTHLVGPTGAVFCFEPDPSTFERLQKNTALNHLSNVHLFQKCLAEHPGTVPFVHAISSVNSRVASELSLSTITVDATTLDAFVEEQALSSIDVLKIDTEGYEYPVLAGGERRALALTKRIVLELHQEADEAKIDGLLSARGFKKIGRRHTITYYERP